MGVAGLSVDTESAERSVESTQRSEDNQSVRIKQYSNKSGTVFGVYGQQPGSNPAQGDTSPNSSGISSPGSSQHGSPARGSNPARGRRRRARSEPRKPRRGDNEKEPSPGSDYGSLLSDVETGDSLLLKLEDSLVLKPGESSSPLITGDSSLHLTCESSTESQRFSAKDCKGVQKGESPDEQTPRQQRRQRQRSASESISDRLSDAQAQRDKELEDLWPESNSLDRNTSQYGNNAVAVRGAKLQQSDAFQRGCQINATVGITGATGNDEFRFTDKNAVGRTGTRFIDSNEIADRTAVEPTGGRVHLSGGNRTNCCGSCERERQASPPPVPRIPVPFPSERSSHSTTSPVPAAQCKLKQYDPITSTNPLLLPKSRSFILPRSQRPSLTATPHSSCSRQQPCRASCRTDRRVVQHGWDGAGIPPDDYQEHQRTKSQQQQHTDPRDTQSSHESLLLTGLTKSHNNKCNNSSNYNNASSCHGDNLGTGSVAGLWWTSGSRSAGCHGSSCCLNVVQDVLSRIPVVAPPTRLSSVLDLRTCNTPPAAALLPAEYPLCNARYVSTSPRPVAPHYATMRIKRSPTYSLMGNLPCWKQRHHHDDNDVKTKHVSYFNISDVTSTFCSVNVYFSFIQT